MLLDLTDTGLIRLNIHADDWRDAVRKAAQPLVDQKKVKPSYVDAIISNVEESGPYIVITPHVALPHARPESGALESAIGIATLDQPVNFGNPDNDPVRYLFCLSATDNEKHLSALAQLANLLERPDFFAMLDEASQPEDVIHYLEQMKGV